MSCKNTMTTEQPLENARRCLLNKNFGRAFAHFLLVLKLSPSKKQEIMHDFAYTMREWTDELEKQNRIEDMFKCYDLACELFPECDHVMNNIGAQLFRLGYVDESALYLRRALRINPDFMAAKENLENVCGHLVERWHFQMLNDHVRNIAFRTAIARAVDEGHKTVLDIGTGTGLLSMFAAESGAKAVFACEQSKTMCELANEALIANKINGDVTVINKLSTDLSIPEDLPDRVSLIITETFDAGLFGENILTTLQHAWQYLLKPTQMESDESSLESRVIPCSATVYVCPIECTTIWKENRLIYPAVQDIDLSSVCITCTTGQDDSEPYTTERLNRIRGGFKKLSEEVEVLSVDFCNLSMITELLAGVSKSISIPVTTRGRLDALAMWFRLNLDDSTHIYTCPEMAGCWEQAVYPVLPEHTANLVEGLVVREGDILDVLCSCQENCLRLRTRRITRRRDIVDIKTLINNSHPKLDKSDDIENSADFPERTKLFLQREEISKLNDMVLNRAYCQALDTVYKELSSKLKRNITVFEASRTLSFLGIQCLKKGFAELVMNMCSLEQEIMLRCLADLNHINVDQMTFVSMDPSEYNGPKFDVIVCDVIEPCGMLGQQILENIAVLKVSCLEKSGVILPSIITAYGVCINSEELLKTSAVINDEKTLGYSIAEFLNDFQMRNHRNIDLSTLSHTRLSEPFKMFQLNFNDSASNTNTGLPHFLEQSITTEAMAIDSGKVTAVVYWFDMTIYNGIKLCTLDVNTHYKQACIMVKQNVRLKSGQDVKLNVRLKNSCIDVKILLDK